MKRKKHIWIGIIALIVGYVSLYVINSECGGYWGCPVGGRIEATAGVRYNSVFLWQPRLGYADGHESTFFGVLFYPLIKIDQDCFHTSLDLFETNSAFLMFSGSNHVKWNPRSLEEARLELEEKSAWREKCLTNADYCIRSVAVPHSREDIHVIAVNLFRLYGTNAVAILESNMCLAKTSIASQHIAHVVEELVGNVLTNHIIIK